MTEAAPWSAVRDRHGSAAEGMHVLVIEDDETFVDLALALLELTDIASVRTSVAWNMAEAEQLLSSNNIDLILADLGLPDARDLDVVDRCRQCAPCTPVIVLTARRDAHLAGRALTNGAQDYLVKGDFDEHDLQRAIRYAVARAQSENELRKAMQQLAETNRQLEEYTTIASHDLRAPVRTARVLFGRIRANPDTDIGLAAGQLGDMLDACLERLEFMLHGLLEYAQAGDDAAVGDRGDESFRDLASEVIADLDSELRAFGARIDIHAAADVRGDPVLLRTLLSNLLRNAVRYRSERPLHIEVRAEVNADGDLCVRVSDNGIGIDPRHRQRVFRMFERVNAGGEGIGLGLTLCHRFVSLAGGRIWIEDGLAGDGISVAFVIPRQDDGQRERRALSAADKG